MKKIHAAILVLALSAAVFTGCRSRMDTQVTTLPPTRATTTPTAPATVPSTAATKPATLPRETIEDGNGPIPGQSTAPTRDSARIRP